MAPGTSQVPKYLVPYIYMSTKRYVYSRVGMYNTNFNVHNPYVPGYGSTCSKSTLAM